MTPTPHEEGADPMELVDRYLQAVRFLLPRRQRADVHRELSAEIHDALEQQAESRGRPLDAEETTDVLKRFGHPLTLALRYQPHRSLVGPETFPFFWFGVRLVLAALAVVHLVLPALFFVATGEPASRVVGLFLRFPSIATPVLFWVTVAAAVLDTKAVRSEVAKALARWTPNDLPPLLKDHQAGPPSVAATVAVFGLGVWWLAALRYPVLLLGPAAEAITFGPAFTELFPLMAFAVFARFLAGLTRFARPHWRRFAGTSAIALDALALVVLFLLARSGTLAAAVRPEHAETARVVSAVAGAGIAAAFAVVAVQLAWKCVRAARTR